MNILSIPTATPLLLLKLTIDRSCVGNIYLENDSENFGNEIADTGFFPISYNIVFLGQQSLPVELTSFDAERHPGDQVLLTWETEQELFNDYFAIEKSFQPNFEEVVELAQIKGQGTTDKAQSYDYLDKTPMAEVVYYRLRNVDLDGDFGYSNTTQVHFDELDFQVKAFPNPTRDFLTVRLSLQKDQAYSLKLYDIHGKAFFHTTQTLGPQIGSDFQVDMREFPSGIYLLEVADMEDKVKYIKVSKY